MKVFGLATTEGTRPDSPLSIGLHLNAVKSTAFVMYGEAPCQRFILGKCAWLAQHFECHKSEEAHFRGRWLVE
jgi:hypothetical protein